METTEPRTRPRPVRTVLAALLLAVLAAMLLLQTGPVKTWAVNSLLARVNPYPQTTLQAGGVHGTVLSSLGLTDLTLVSAAGDTTAAVDSAYVRYSLLPALMGRIRIGEVTVRGARLQAERDTSGAVDLLAPFLSDDTTSSDIRLSKLRISDADLALRDSAGLWELRDLEVSLSDLRTAPVLTLELDSLSGRVVDPISSVPGTVHAAGRISAGLLRVDSLLFATSRSRLTAHGQVGGETWPADSVRFQLNATPLHLDDVRPLVPQLEGGQEIRIAAVLSSAHTLNRVQLEADLGTGGQVSVDLESRIPEIGADSARVEGRIAVRDLQVDRIVREVEQVSPITFESDINLRGSDWRALSGSWRITAGTFLFRDTQISELEADQTWEGSRVDLVVQAVVDGSPVSVSGTVEPLDPALPVNLRGTASRVVLERWTGGALTGTATGRFTLRGELIPGRYQAGLALSESRVGPCAVSGTVDLDSDPDELRARLDLGACDGLLAGTASYRPATEAWQLTQVRISELPLARLMGDTTRSVVNATLTGTGRGADYTGTLRLDSTTYDSYRVDSLTAEVSGTSADWAVEGRLHSGAGSADFDIHGRGAEGVIRLLDVRRLDLSYAAGLPALSTSISGSVSGRFGPDQTNLEIRLDTTRVNDQRILSGQASLALLADSLRSTGAVALTAGGGISWRGSGRLDAGSYRVDSLGFAGIDLSAFRPGTVPTSLSGGLEGALNVLGDSLAAARASLVLAQGGHISGVPIQGGQADLSFAPDTARAEGGFGLGRGAVAFSGTFSQQREEFDGVIRARDVDVLRIAGYDSTGSSLTTALRLRGTGQDLRSGRFLAHVDTLRGTYGPIRVDSARGVLRWADGLLTIDSLRVMGDPVQARINGRLPVGSEAPDTRYQLTGTFEGTDIAPVAALFDLDLHTVSSRLTVRGSGRPGQFQVSAEGQVEGIRYGDVHVAEADILASAELADELHPTVAEARVTTSLISLPDLSAESGTLTLSLADDSVRVEGRMRVDRNHSLEFGAGANRRFDRIRVDALGANLDQAAWQLSAPAEVSLVDGIEISGLVAEADSQRIALGGYLGTSAGDDLYLSASDVRLDPLADLWGFQGFGATLNTTLSITSSGPGAERAVSGTLSGAVRHRGESVGTVDGRLSLRDRRLNLDAAMEHRDGSVALVRGFVPFAIDETDLTADPVSIRLEATDFPIDWTLPFFDPLLVDDLRGEVTTDLSVRGTYGAPRLAGGAELTSGRLGLPDLGTKRESLRYEDARVSLTFQDEAIRVDSASVRSGGGRATASGTIALQDLSLGEIDLNVRASNFLAVDSEEYTAVVGAVLRLRGTTVTPRLGGSVRVEQGDFRLTDETTADAFEPVTLTQEDLLTLEERFGIRVSESDTTSFDFYEAMEIVDLRIDLARNTWLRATANPRMDIQFTGSIDVSKRPNQDLRVFGTIEVIPDRSRIEQFGRQFSIESGTLTFNGPADQPRMNLAAAYEVRSRGTQSNEVTIRLQATGSPEDLTVSFDSDPAMELADIVSYIATGRPASESLQFGGTSSENYLRSAAGLAVGPITGLVENLAGSNLGLDVVEIEQSESSGLMLTAGKYVSPRFFVSVSQPLSLSSSASSSSSTVATEVTLEYELIRSILVSLMSQGTVVRVNLRWERSF